MAIKESKLYSKRYAACKRYTACTVGMYFIYLLFNYCYCYCYCYCLLVHVVLCSFLGWG